MSDPVGLMLVNGPFGGIPAVSYVGLPEHLRAYLVGGEVVLKPEADADWPERAARYSLTQSNASPATYVYDGVGDGGPRVEGWKHEGKPARIWDAPVHAVGPASVYANGVFIGTAERVEWR